MNGLHTAMAKSGLVRGDDRWLGGVCSGVAHKLGVDPGAIRLVMVLLLLLPGSQLIVYPLLWLAMPDAATAARLTGPAGQSTLSEGYPGAPGPQDRLH